MVVEKTYQLTEKDKETPKEPLGVFSLLSIVIIIRTRGANRGGNKSGNGSEIRKDSAQRFGVCNEHIKSVPDLENTDHQRRGYGPGRKYGRQEFQRKKGNRLIQPGGVEKKQKEEPFSTEFIISAQMNHLSPKILWGNMLQHVAAKVVTNHQTSCLALFT